MGNMVQESFNPVDYLFMWTNEWYQWDSIAGHILAKDERDKEAALLKRQGYTVKKSTLKNQLITRGGIGSGHPHVEFVVTIYKLIAVKKKQVVSGSDEPHENGGHSRTGDSPGLGYMQGRGAA